MKNNTKYTELMEEVFLMQFGFNEGQYGRGEGRYKQQKFNDIDLWLYPSLNFYDFETEESRTVSVKHNRSGLKYGSIILETTKIDTRTGNTEDSWFKAGTAQIYAFAQTNYNESKRYDSDSFWYVVKADKLKEVVNKCLENGSMSEYKLSDKEAEKNRKFGNKFDSNLHVRVKVDDLKYLLNKEDYVIIPIDKRAFRMGSDNFKLSSEALEKRYNYYVEEKSKELFEEMEPCSDYDYIENSYTVQERCVDKLFEKGKVSLEDYKEWFETKL